MGMRSECKYDSAEFIVHSKGGYRLVQKIVIAGDLFKYSFFVLTTYLLYYLAVQQERKPPEPRDKMSMNMATSTQKIYIRKDLSSPTPSVPFFLNKNVSKKPNCLHTVDTQVTCI